MALTTIGSITLGASTYQSFLGPFVDANGNLYVVGRDASSNTRIRMMKSTNGGTSWSVADDANRPSFGAGEVVWAIAAVQDGTTIHIACHRQPPGGKTQNVWVRYATFNMSDAASNPDTWSLASPRYETIGTFDIGDAGEITSYPGVAIAVRSDGDVLVIHPGSNFTDMGTDYFQLSLSRREGGSWTTDIALTGEADNQASPAMIMDPDDACHLAYVGASGTVLADTYTSANAFTGRIGISIVPSTGREGVRIVTFDVSGTDKAVVSFRDSANQIRTRRVEKSGSGVALESGQTATVATTDIAATADNIGLAVDLDNNDVYLVWQRSSDADLYYDINAGGVSGGWGTDTELEDAVTLTGSWARVYTRGGSKYLGYVVRSGTDLQFGELLLAAGNTQLSGAGANASDGSGDLSVTRGLSGSGPASSDGVGTLSPIRGIAGSGANAAAGSGDLTVTTPIVDLSGSGANASAGTGVLDLTVDLVGSGPSASDGSGDLSLTRGLAGSGANASAGSGDLTIIGVSGQTGFRIRSGDTVGLNVDSGWEAALNQDASMAILDLPFRIRFLIANASGSAVNDGYQLRVSINSGAYTLIQNNSDPYTLVGEQPKYTAEAIPSDQYADLDATTQLIGTGTFTAGVGNEDNTSSIINLPDGNETELEWCINLRKLAMNLAATDGVHIADGDTIDFRVYYDDGTVLPGYGQTPRVTIANRAGHIGGTEVEYFQRGFVVDKSGNFYYLTEYADLNNNVGNKPVMMKSTDDGVSWNPVDEAGAPDVNGSDNDLESADMDYVAADDEIYILMQGGNGNDVQFWSFNTADHPSAADQWNLDQTVDTASTPGDQQATIHKRSDGTIVGFYADNDGNERIRYRIRSSGGTWGAEQTLDSEASTHFGGVRTVLDPATDIIHIFYHAWNNTVGEIWYNTLSAADALGTRVQVDQGTVTINADGGSRVNNVGPPVIWDKAGTKQIGVIYHGDGPDDVVWNETDVATPDWTTNEQVALSTVDTHWLGGAAAEMALAVDDDHDEIWVWGIDQTTQALEYDRQRSGTWDGDTTYDSDDHFLILPLVFAKQNGDLVIGFIRNDHRGLTGVARNPGNGFVRYDEILIARRLAGSGAAASAGSGDLTVTTGGTVDLAGSGANASAGSGDITVFKFLSGSGANAADGSGAIDIRVSISGSGPNASDGVGTLSPRRGLSGAGANANAGQGTLSVTRGLTGSGASASEGAGALDLSVDLTGAGPNASEGQADVLITRGIAGSGASASDGTGALDVTLALAGSGANASAGTGSLDVLGQVDLSGSGPNASDGFGALDVLLALAGSGASASDGRGVLSPTRGIAGSGANASAGSGDLTVKVPLSGAGGSASAGSGAMLLTLGLTGSGPNANDGFGSIVRTLGLAGSGASSSDGTGDLTVILGIIDLSGSGPNASAGVGTLLITRGIAGAGPSASAGFAVLAITRGLSGAGASASAGTSTLFIIGAPITRVRHSDVVGGGVTRSTGVGAVTGPSRVRP